MSNAATFTEFLDECTPAKIHEASGVDNDLIEQFKGLLTPIFRKYFPNGFFDVTATALSDGKSIWVKCGIINDLADQTSHIRQNDPLRCTYNIQLLPDGLFELSNRNGISISVKPRKRNLAMSSEKIAFRKSKGGDTKIVVAFERSIKKVRAVFDKVLGEDDLYKQDQLKEKYKK